MKYLVFWTLVQIHYGLCPLPPKLDASGRDTAAYTPATAIQNCWRADTIPMQKEFKTRAEAEKFKKAEESARAKENAAKVAEYGNYEYAHGKAFGYRIDSLKIK